VVAPVAMLAVVLGSVAPGLVVQDTWLTLVSGREIVKHGLPHADHLTVFANGHHWVDQQWLAQLLFYSTERLAGLGGVLALQIVAVAIAFGVAAYTATRRGASPVVLLVFFIAAVAAAPWAFQARAQGLALPLFSATVALLVSDPRAERRRTLLALPFLVLWGNVHGSAALGAAILVLYGAHALVVARRRAQAWVFLCAPLLLCASPYALDLPGYYHLILVDPPFARHIVEWQRTTPSAETGVFFGVAAAALVVVAARWRRLTVLDGLVLAMTLASALDAVRGIVWFALAMLIILPGAASRTGTPALSGRGATMIAACAVAAVVAALAVTAARDDASLTRKFPDGAAQLVAENATGNIYANDDTADWLLWKVPQLRGRIAYDVRFELLTRTQIQRILAFDNRDPGWLTALRTYSVVVADRAHGAAIAATDQWRSIYDDGSIVVAARR